MNQPSELFRRLTPPQGDDPDFDEVYRSLTVQDQTPSGLTRRHFLAGMLATGGALTLANGPFARPAEAIAPLGPRDPILVVILLGGGNDGINTVIPIGDPGYDATPDSLRRGLSASTGAYPLASSGLALHKALPRLAFLTALGKVAIVTGTGEPEPDFNHFTSMATMMAGTTGTPGASGWLGRYIDTLADGDGGLRGVAIGADLPLHMSGERSHITTLGDRPPFGLDREAPWQQALYGTLDAIGDTPMTRGGLANDVAQAQGVAMATAQQMASLYPVSLTGSSLIPTMDLVAQAINLNLGTQVYAAMHPGYDTHASQLYAHNVLLTNLDAAIGRFYEVINPTLRRQVVIMTFSEFGRRAVPNGSGGTDHGTSAPMFLLGDGVRGGIYGTQPSLTDLDGDNLRTPVDFRRVYASVLGGWLGADPNSILGGSYAPFNMFNPL